jgi:patatin-like phospholipase/acyl hydrolase
MIRILSIDGGGIRGIIPASVLAEIELITGKPAAKIFDLIAGTSTGGMLSLGLNIPDETGSPRNSAASMRELYETKGREIFQKTLWRKLSSMSGYIDTEYGHKFLEGILDQYMGDYTFSESITKSLVTSYDLGNREPFIFRSWEDKFQQVLMKDAGRATSAAPTYFEPAVLNIEGVEHTLIDGGVFLNNPALSAYLEAVSIFPDEDEFLLISLGTGENTRPISFEEAKNWGKIEWAVPIFDVIFDGLNDAIDYHLTQMLGSNYYRLQNKVALESFGMTMEAETEGQIEDIISDSQDLVRKNRKLIGEICKRLV